MSKVASAQSSSASQARNAAPRFPTAPSRLIPQGPHPRASQQLKQTQQDDGCTPRSPTARPPPSKKRTRTIHARCEPKSRAHNPIIQSTAGRWDEDRIWGHREKRTLICHLDTCNDRQWPQLSSKAQVGAVPCSLTPFIPFSINGYSNSRTNSTRSQNRHLNPCWSC